MKTTLQIRILLSTKLVDMKKTAALISLPFTADTKNNTTQKGTWM